MKIAKHKEEYISFDKDDIRLGSELVFTGWHSGPREFTVTDDNIKSILRDIGKTQLFQKRLTHEQILTEGFELKGSNGIVNWYKLVDNPFRGSIQDYYRYKCYGVQLLHDPEFNKVKISYDWGGGYEAKNSQMFEGFCPSINELRYIFKLLKFYENVEKDTTQEGNQTPEQNSKTSE